MNELRIKGKACVESHSTQALAISFVPLISMPLVHGVCVKMILQLDEIFGIPTAKGIGSEVFEDVLVGIIAAPVLMVPFLGAFASAAYIRTTGEYYLEAVANIVESGIDLSDADVVSAQIKDELHTIHEKRRNRRKGLQK